MQGVDSLQENRCLLVDVLVLHDDAMQRFWIENVKHLALSENELIHHSFRHVFRKAYSQKAMQLGYRPIFVDNLSMKIPCRSRPKDLSHVPYNIPLC